MAITETEAIVIRSYNLAEADKIVVCLTRSSGLVRAVAKGSRKLKNRFGAALEPFTVLNLTYYQKENQELASMRQAEILKSNFNISGEHDILTGLAYMGDLVVEFSPPHQTNDKLFRMVNACIEAVAASPADLQLILRYFEVWILRLEGFFPDLRRCADCQKSLTGEKGISLSRELGLLCRQCTQGMGEVLSSKAYERLCATQALGPAVFAQESRGLSNKIQSELAELMHRMLGRVLERRPRVQLAFQPRA
ncbi:MAG TPA: DNA repair protein RecO [Pyrinomonadaceae bacterium]|nr:DNA repair protein RecO [Pyrinomonadaceae bacterium]